MLKDKLQISRSQPGEILKLKDELYQIISKHSGQSKEKVTENSDRDYWMKAEEAKNYGMVDEVLKNAPQ